MSTVLVARLDSDGDVLLAGPAVRAVAAGATRVVLLAGPRGAAAGRLLPGVDEVVVWRCPWIDADPLPVDAAEIGARLRCTTETARAATRELIGRRLVEQADRRFTLSRGVLATEGAATP